MRVCVSRGQIVALDSTKDSDCHILLRLHNNVKDVTRGKYGIGSCVLS